jgi:hypothetical protein
VPDADRVLDAEEIFRVLAEHEVDYVLIGGLAVQTHGHLRSTADADIIPAPDRLNLERLTDALAELDAVILNPIDTDDELSADLLPRATLWQFATTHGGLDVAHDVPGGAPYADLAGRALVVHLGDIAIRVVSLDDLIRMKLASGRPVDLDDVAALTDETAGEN